MIDQKLIAIAAVAGVLIICGAVYIFGTGPSGDVEYKEVDSIEGFSIDVVSGDDTSRMYKNSYGEYTVVIEKSNSDSTYILSGVMKGNLSVEDTNGYDVTLILDDINISSNYSCPVEVNKGDVTIQSIDGTDNRIGDFRDFTEGVYTLTSNGDLSFEGSGTLYVQSTHNGGMITSGNMVFKDTTLVIESIRTSLVSGDLTVTSGNIEMMSHEDCGIVSAGDVIINTDDGETNVQIHSSMNGITAEKDLNIDGDPSITIRTADMSPMSDRDTIYIGYSSTKYTFSILVKDSNGDTQWINPAGEPTLVHDAMAKSYVYTFKVPMDVKSFMIYAYSSSQLQGQDTAYHARSNEIQTGFERNSFLITQCASKMPILYKKADFGGPDQPDFNKLPTAGMNVEGSISINGGDITIDSNGDSIVSKNKIDITSGKMTTFSRSCGISCDDLEIEGGDIVLISTGNNSSSIHSVKKYVYDDGRVIAISVDSKDAREHISNCEDFPDISVMDTLSNVDAGSYVQISDEDEIIAVISMPDNSTGAPPKDIRDPKQMDDPKQSNDKLQKVDVPDMIKKNGQGFGDRPYSNLLVTYLGSSDVEIALVDSTTKDLDDNGVYWSE